MANISNYLKQILTARYGKDVRQSIHDGIEAINNEVAADKAEIVESKNLAATSASEAALSAQNAANSANTATVKATAAANSETNAKTSETNAKTSATTASEKATAAATSEANAKTSAESATTNAATATQKASDASTYANNAKASANTANTHAATASEKATAAANSANTATVKANSASDSAVLAESYAVGGTGIRENEDVDNARYYKEQAEQISQGLSGALLPMGTITFSQLRNQTKQPGYMYNINDSFTTDETFREGAGYAYAAGTNVYCTVDGLWDCIAGTNVVGVKGAKESSYRKGNVNITPENIGALPEDGNAKTATKATQDANGNNIVDTYQTKTGDTASNSVAFSSGDSTSPTGWADIVAVGSGETHASLFRKFSLAVKNLRYLYKMLGTTDISAIGDGTVTGGISKLNNNLAVRNLKTYTGISLLGLSADNTIDEIMEALPLNSMLVMQIASGTTVLNQSLPTNARGQLEIKKSDSSQRGHVEYKLYDNNVVYVNHYLNGTLGEWDTLVLNSNFVKKTGFKKKKLQIYLGNVTWTETNSGLYMTEIDVSDISYTTLLSFTYSSTWKTQKTDVFLPSLNITSSQGERLLLYSNRNDFSADSYFYGTLLYV